MKKAQSLIEKYEYRAELYDKQVNNNSGTTKNLCIVQRDLCNEIVKDLKGETVIKVRQRSKKLRPAKRIKNEGE